MNTVTMKDNKISIKIDYDLNMIAKIKSIRGRQWDPKLRIWAIPALEYTTVSSLLQGAIFEIGLNNQDEVLIEINTSFASIYSSNEEVYDIVRQISTYYVKNARFSDKYKSGEWDGKICLYNEFCNMLPIGLVDRLKIELKDYQVVIKDNQKKLFSKEASLDFILRGYQKEALDAWRRNDQRGIIALSPGLGKTEIAIQAIAELNTRTLFLVHSQDLAIQTVERLKKALKCDIGFVGAGENRQCDVNVAIVQTLYSQINNPKIKRLLSSCNFVVVDEAHHYSARMFKTVLSKIKATARLGLTATPYREQEDELVFISQLGDVVYEMNLKDAVDLKWLCKPKFIFNSHDGVKRSRVQIDYSYDYDINVVTNQYRNKTIIRIAEDAMKQNKSVLILVNRIEHGNILDFALGDSCVFLTGRHKKEFRKETLDLFKTKELKCIIATSIFDEGIDVPQIDVLINAVAQKSKGRYIQRIGRAMRRNKDKDSCEIHDFIDAGPYTSKHSHLRKKAIQDEGFQVVVI